MKKTTYILIALVIAGIIFAVFVQVAYNRTFRSTVNIFETESAATITEIALPQFGKLYIGRVSGTYEGITYKVSITSSDAVPSPVLKIADAGKDFIRHNSAADCLSLVLDVTKDFIETNNIPDYTPIEVPIEIVIPAGAPDFSLYAGKYGSITLKGFTFANLWVDSPDPLVRISADSCNIQNVNANCGLNLCRSTVATYNLNINQSQFNRFDCSEGARIDTLTATYYDGTYYQLDLFGITIGEMKLQRGAEGGVMQMKFGPNTTIGNLLIPINPAAETADASIASPASAVPAE